MRITPLDVRKQEFRKGMRGLDAEEVYAFLATVADEYETVLNDNKALRERLLELDDKVQEYRSMEKTLRDTLLTAERVTVEAKDNARREANLIIKEAQIEAEKALRDIKSEAMRMRQQVQQLRSQRDGYMAKMKVIVKSHLDFLKSGETEFQQEDKAIEDLDVNAPERPRSVDHSTRTTNLFEKPVQAPAAPQPAVPPPPTASPVPDERPSAVDTGTTEPGKRTFTDLNAILERMAESQRATLQADSQASESPNAWQQIAETEVQVETLEHTSTAVEEPSRSPVSEERRPDVTSEMNLEEIRRRLDESAKAR